MSKGAKGLSLFIVAKEPLRGHDFEMHAARRRQARRQGRRDARLPRHALLHAATSRTSSCRPTNLVGGEGGLGKGFYLQMGGFAAGRLQTGGRACGLAQAALEKTVRVRRSTACSSARPIVEYQLTQYMLGRMAAQLAAARAITYAAARAMDEDERKAAPLAAQAKLLACDIAVAITQDGAAAARRLGLRRGVPDQPLRRRCAGAADLRGREADPRAQGRRAEPARGVASEA